MPPLTFRDHSPLAGGEQGWPAFALKSQLGTSPLTLGAAGSTHELGIAPNAYEARLDVDLSVLDNGQDGAA